MLSILCLLAAALNAAPIDFAKTVFPILNRAGCVDCHKDNGVASPTRLHFPEGKPSVEEIQSFGLSLHVLVDRADPAKSLLLNKPTQRVAHAGGKRLEPGSGDEKTLRAWVDYLASATPEALSAMRRTAASTASSAVLRRLTHNQYNNTMRDLLGDSSRLADQFPPEDFVNGFRNQFQSQSTSPLLAESYAAAAEKLARKAFLGGDTRNLIPCKPKSFDDAACRDRFLRDFGGKAFRRPLHDAEIARYAKLFASEAAASKQFVDGARAVVEVMLQSPNFLLRVENGSDAKVRPYETASRLSYFLWDSMPDAALLAAAASGELNTAEGIAKQARRMLASDNARGSVDEFLSEWLRFDRLAGTVRDRRLYPQFTAELTVAMVEETRRLAAHLIWSGGNFMEFFSAPYTFLNADLAKLYNVPAPKGEYDRVDLSSSTFRAGVLSHASFLAMTSKPAETSPTSRGLFVREQFLCQEVPQPPPGVNANLPPLTREQPRTQKERLRIHLESESCASCHRLIDPIGLGFEKFDAIGGYRDKLKLNILPGRAERNEAPKYAELELDTAGSVTGLPNSAFSSPRELGIILAATAQCQQCVVKQLFRYMAGRMEGPSDRALIEGAFEDFRKSGFRFQDLMVGLLQRSAGPAKKGMER